MKRKSFFTSLATTALALMLTVSGSIDAFNYNITFTGSNASTSVTSVEVQNLTKGTTVTVPAGNTLNLYDVVSSFDQPSINDEAIRVYPNPMQGKSTVSFFTKQAGNTQINVFGLDGRNLAGINSNLNAGNNQFQLSLASGAYILKVNGNGFTYASRVICQSNATNKPNLSYIGNEKLTNSQPQKAKNGGAVISMLYSVGDQLLYKGTSGNYTTIVTDKPTESKSTNFYFVECKDADGNYYPVVIIGSQIWMAENLKTTSYRNGYSIGKPSTATNWKNANFGAWCDYSGDVANGTIYGHLYNWYSVYDIQNIAPMGWHVATDAEWTTLINYLGGESIAGGKLKEAGTLNWLNPNTDATNYSGFSALPGGYRGSNGTFNAIGFNGQWWSSDQNSSSNAWSRDFYYNYSIVYRNGYSKVTGLSVRCLSDLLIVILPTLATTTSATAITETTASSGGNITTEGGAAVTTRGVCWSTIPNPTIALSTKTSDGTGIGVFTSTLTGLSSNTTYYVRSYATNSEVTSYGEEVSFQTATAPLTISTAIIPAGTFTMGSPDNEAGRNINETQHSVTLSSFRMSKYEITNAQYASFLNAKNIGSNGIYPSGSYPTYGLIMASSGNYDWGLHFINSKWTPAEGFENAPVVNVSWRGATEFATYAGGSLPTEAQWEYACRGGTTTPFSSGDCLTDLQANYEWSTSYNNCNNTNLTSPGKTQDVGTYAPNNFGLYDMQGNAAEWCADWFGDYSTTAQTNPTGATTGVDRVIRSGNYATYPSACRSAFRYRGSENGIPIYGLGFRVVFAQ